MSSDVVIVSTGLMCSVGLSTKEVAAASRAKTMRFEDSPVFDHRFKPVAAALVPDDALPPLRDEVVAIPNLPSRVLRMLRLATMPLRECAAPLNGARAALFLALPETATTVDLDPGRFAAWLALQAPDVWDATRAVANRHGRAGGLFALGDAVEAIASGRAQFAIAGGVDTYLDLFVLGTLNSEGRVKSETTLDGFIPGEGAAFVLLTSSATAVARGLPTLGRVSSVARGHESGHLYSDQPYRGEGLAATIRSLLATVGSATPIEEVYSAMNGESHWGKEWGVAFLRNRAGFAEGHTMTHPADSYGDIGAASGPMMVALAALGMHAGRSRGPALVYASSDRGPRAACTVHALS
jgi:3-oxoacyl-[acyl-carrier-protein] synthase I